MALDSLDSLDPEVPEFSRGSGLSGGFWGSRTSPEDPDFTFWSCILKIHVSLLLNISSSP